MEKRKIFLTYFLVTFSSFNIFFAIRKITNAIMMKFISSPRKAPQPNTIGPSSRVAVFHAPSGTKGVMSGIMILSTSDFIRAVDAIPMIIAIASGITLYS